MRIVYLGSPSFAVPTLRALAVNPAFEIALVVTQAAKGASPVETEANSLHLPIFKPKTLRDPEARERLRKADADLFVVAAFGLILGRNTLAIPRRGAINIHPSLLPKYRGASPIMAAVLQGDSFTGVSLMVMDTNIDTGPVISKVSEVVASDDTTESLGDRLAVIAAQQATHDVPLWVSGEIAAQPQTLGGASMTRPLVKLDGLIDWRESASAIDRLIRAMWPWPRAWTLLDGSPFQVHRARIAPAPDRLMEPGTISTEARHIVVACGDGVLELLLVEPAGRRAMTGSAFLNGRRTPLTKFITPDDVLKRPPLIVPVDGAEDRR